MEQLACIMEVLGVPSESVIAQASRLRLFFDSKGNPRSISNSKGRKRKPGSRALAVAMRCTDKLFVDFISQCLQWDAKKRMTPEEALKHEWLASASQPELRRSPSEAATPTAVASTPRTTREAEPATQHRSELRDHRSEPLTTSIVNASSISTISGSGTGSASASSGNGSSGVASGGGSCSSSVGGGGDANGGGGSGSGASSGTGSSNGGNCPLMPLHWYKLYVQSGNKRVLKIVDPRHPMDVKVASRSTNPDFASDFSSAVDLNLNDSGTFLPPIL